jgi:hypothetical protein
MTTATKHRYVITDDQILGHRLALSNRALLMYGKRP